MRQQGRLSYSGAAVLLETALRTVRRRVELVPAELYAYREAEARRRIPCDPDDWPTVALALALDAGIWTNDYDFFGCGVATWTTETLIAHLQSPQDR
jgi:predicted nucleic acid-binding protein